MTLGKFDHHPNPAIDFCTEVDVLTGMKKDLENAQATFDKRYEIAFGFRVGGDEHAVMAMRNLRALTLPLGSEGDK